VTTHHGYVPEPVSERLLSDLNVAINESELHDIRVDSDRRDASLLLTVLTLPEVGPKPEDRRVVLRLMGVSRVAASLRQGRWDDANAAVETTSLEDLSEVVRSFGGQPVYGWEFFDPSPQSWQGWHDRLGLDQRFDGAADGHVLELPRVGGGTSPTSRLAALV
jgi:hypothetical protein